MSARIDLTGLTVEEGEGEALLSDGDEIPLTELVNFKIKKIITEDKMGMTTSSTPNHNHRYHHSGPKTTAGAVDGRGQIPDSK